MKAKEQIGRAKGGEGTRTYCLICGSEQRHLHAYADHAHVSALDLECAKQEFLDASVAVWREIDRLSAMPEGYHGLPPETDPRKRELVAWEHYRALLDRVAPINVQTCRHAKERDALAAAIAKAAIKAGIIKDIEPLTGPQLIMLCDDLASGLKNKEA